MDTVDSSSRKEKESESVPTFLKGTQWTVEKPELCAVGEWIEFGRKLRSAPDKEILSLISSVESYLEGVLNDETLARPEYRQYARRYANTILKAARAELRKRNLELLG
jgi:hypothetical protein